MTQGIYQRRTLCILSGIMFLSLVLVVESRAEEAEEKKWNDEAELSYIETSGNTKLTTLSAKNLLKYQFSKKFNTAWKIGALYGEDQGERNTEKYNTDLKFSYMVTKRFFTLLTVGWMKDRYAGIDYRANAGPGAGFKFLDGPKNFLVGELGVEYVEEKDTENNKEDYARGRTFLEYNYAFTKKNKFTQSIEYLNDFEDSENYTINSITALISSINDALSLKVSYEVEYNNEPAVEKGETLDDTDTMLTLALVVNF